MNPIYVIAISFMIIFLLSVVLTRLFAAFAKKIDLVDTPNHRTSHEKIIPRGAGVVFVSIWLFFTYVLKKFGLLSEQQILIIFPPAIAIALIGYLDDVFELPARIRFLFYLVAAIYCVRMFGGMHSYDFGAFALNLGWAGTLLTVLASVWSINLYNFMDGVDGIAATEAIFIYGAGGMLLWHAGGAILALMAWALAVSVLGFLVWNWPSAKVFMGDVGSVFLGFMIVPFAIAGELWYGLPAIIWIIPYGLFLVDATMTLIRRIAHGDKWYMPHRSHAYQRLLQSGCSRSSILLGVVIVNSLLSIAAWYANYYRGVLPWIVLGALSFCLIIYELIELREPMYPRGKLIDEC